MVYRQCVHVATTCALEIWVNGALTVIPVANDYYGHTQEVWKVFIMACETKHSRMSLIGLSAIQKLVANEAISPEPMPRVLIILKQARLSIRLASYGLARLHGVVHCSP